MSSMLEQAIVDAKALREAALKNAEQSLIEKYAPQIKEAVDSILESDEISEKFMKGKKVQYEGNTYEVVSESEDGKIAIVREGEKPHLVLETDLQEAEEEIIQEEEIGGPSVAGSAPGASFEPPSANNSMVDMEQEVLMSFKEKDPSAEGMFNLDLEDIKAEMAQEDTDPSDPAGPSDVLSDLGISDDGDEGETEGDELGLDLNLQEQLVDEIASLLNDTPEENILEEELIVDTSAQKDGTFQTNQELLEYQRDLELAKMESTKYKEENEVLEKKLKELQENFKKLRLKNKQYKDVVEKINEKLNETLLSNAKLLYSNKTLSDASLNERQKTKIVEAIAKAKTPEEAKTLCEALNATVTSGNDKKTGPRTLSESVQRKSNLSGILPRRNRQDNEKQHTFADHMKKLAGIK